MPYNSTNNNEVSFGSTCQNSLDKGFTMVILYDYQFNLVHLYKMAWKQCVDKIPSFRFLNRPTFLLEKYMQTVIFRCDGYSRKRSFLTNKELHCIVSSDGHLDLKKKNRE